MKALTLTQPWATLVALGAKKIETRSWRTSYRGPLAIHAGESLALLGGTAGLVQLCGTEPFKTALAGATSDWNVLSLPRGFVVATCELVECVQTNGPWTSTVSFQERAFGDYTVGRWAWLLEDVRALPAPVPHKGNRLLWELPEEVLREALAEAK